MKDTKRCAACDRPIDASAKLCPGCGAPQPVARLKHTAMMPAVTLPLDEAEPPSPAGTASGRRAREPHPSQTADTLLHLEDAARRAVERARAQPPAGAPGTGNEPSSDDASRDPPAGAARLAEATRGPVSPALARAVMLGGGATLLLFFAFTADVLGALGGNQLILGIYYLVGGLLLALGAVLPLPNMARAGVATAVGAVPLFVAPPLVELDGWRGLAAALVVLLLPGALLLRARVTGSRIARLFVAVAVALTALIYAVPLDGVVPGRLALDLLASRSIDHTLVGVIALAPLALALATLTAFLPRTSTAYGRLWAVLVIGAVSGSVSIAGLSGTRADLTLVQLGPCLAAAAAAAAVGVAQLFDLDDAHAA